MATRKKSIPKLVTFRSCKTVQIGPFVTFAIARGSGYLTPGEYAAASPGSGIDAKYANEPAYTGQVLVNGAHGAPTQGYWVRVPCRAFSVNGKELTNLTAAAVKKKNAPVSFVFDENAQSGVWVCPNQNFVSNTNTLIPTTFSWFANSMYRTDEHLSIFPAFVCEEFQKHCQKAQVELERVEKLKEKEELQAEAKRLGITLTELRARKSAENQKVKDVKAFEKKLEMLTTLKAAISTIETAIDHLEKEKSSPETVKELGKISDTFGTVSRKYSRLMNELISAKMKVSSKEEA